MRKFDIVEVSFVFKREEIMDKHSNEIGKLPAVLQRFLHYVDFETASDIDSQAAPSTASQLVLGRELVRELLSLGVTDARMSPEGVVTGSIPASRGCEDCPAIGFIAHMDTSPEAKGGPVNWRIVRYQGKDIVLDAEKEILLSRERFPELDRYHGQDLVVTDGHTLLGADDKAGIAAIMTMVDVVTSHPDMPHAKICIAFTPDEEVGRGTENFDIQGFGADYAYTVDGGELGELNSETFCAAIATVTMKGVSVHPGSAKNKMVNALRLVTHLMNSMPADEVPEKTEGYEGFYHPIRVEGGVEEATLLMLIRDHDRRRFESRKAALQAREAEYNAYGEGTCTISIKEQYLNMQEYLQDVPAVMELARAAYRAAGITPRERPIRGGTDGARLSERGLPCPNLFTGGLNFHGIYECLPVESLEKSAEVTIRLAELSARMQSLSEPPALL